MWLANLPCRGLAKAETACSWLCDGVCTVQGCPHNVLAGDLNSPPDSLEVQLIRQLLPHLHDSWGCAQDSPSAVVAGPCNTAGRADAGATANAPSNSFGGARLFCTAASAAGRQPFIKVK